MSTTPLTPDEFAAEMTRIAALGDEEISHGKGDELMMDTLRALGYSAGVDAFAAMDRWYA